MRAVLLACVVAVAAAQPSPPEPIALVNAKVFTADAAAPWAEAVLIRGQVVVAVGASDAIRRQAGTSARVIDAGGRVVVPGFNDAHTHPGARPPAVRLEMTPMEPSFDGHLETYADTRANRRLATSAGTAELISSLRRTATAATELGVTSLQAMSNVVEAPVLFSRLIDAATPVRWRVIRFPLVAPGTAGDPDMAPVLRNLNSPLVSISGIEWILDGTPIERLAAMNEPYADRPDTRGRINFTPEQIEGILRRTLDGGEPVMFHATGDRTIDLILSTMERLAPPERWERARVRIEHGEFLTGPRIPRAKRLGIVVVQNPTHLTIGDVMKARYGATRAATAQPLKSLLDAGIPLAIGSDGPMEPGLNLMFAVTDPGNPKEALTREQAVAAYTAGSAYAEFTEMRKGTLRVGYLADLAVLSQDVFTVPADKLPGTKSVLTMVGGRVVYDALTGR